jgi:eukaryotic-like serine/threonine-protein kinase
MMGAPPAPLLAALQDRYRLERELGQGGMATVYLAEDVKHHRKVAVKVLRPELAAALGPERFLREITITAQLDHPHILSLLDSGQAGDFLYYVMPFVDGESLRDRLMRERQLSIEDALQIVHEVAEALGYAHARRLIHRDIKPENILLSGGHARVADFGIARAVSSAGADKLTQTGMAVGTPAYMSPEQSVGESDIDARSDLYALGCVLYEMLAGEPPYTGMTAQAIIAKRFREPVPRVSTLRESVPPALEATLERVLAKSPADRFATAEEFSAALRAPVEPAIARPAEVEEFRIAVLPFKYSGANADLTALAEGLTEETITGLSRFTYLRVIARGSTLQVTGEAVDVRAVGTRLGARYVLEGSLRQAGSALRVSIQLVDTTSGAHLWAETYDRPFQAENIFALQDELVPRIVSSVADAHGILPHTLSEALRSRDPGQLTPYEAVLRSFGYGYRMTPEEHATVRAALERAVQQAPGYADAWGMLSLLYTEEFSNGFNARPDPLGRALQAARRAADAAPSSALAYNALARALFFRKEFQAFRVAADRAIELNPLNGPTVAGLGGMMAYAGDWEYGCAQAERARRLNPRHPGGYWFPLFYNAYRQGDYRGAVSVGLKINLPDFFATHEALASAYGQLGERDAAARHLRELLRLKPDFVATMRDELGKWFDRDMVEHQIDGLRKAGLEIAGGPATPPASKAARLETTTPSGSAERPAIAVLPFVNSSPDPGNDFFSDGLTEEIITDLARIKALSVISRTSVMRLKGTDKDARTIGRELGVRYLLEGSVRRAGSSLRITAQLIDAQNDAQLWAEKYNGTVNDVFDVQERVSRAIVDALNVTLSSDEDRHLADRPIRDIRAFEFFLQARQEIRRYSLERGVALLEQAIAIEGPVPALRALRAWGLIAQVRAGMHRDLKPLDEAEAEAQALIAIAPEAAYGHQVMGFVHYERGNLREGVRSLYAALERDPTDADAAFFLGISLSAAGQSEAAIRQSRRFTARDPLSPMAAMLAGAVTWFVGRPAEGLEACERALEMDPENRINRWTLGYHYALLGRLGDAAAQAQWLHERAPTMFYAIQLRALVAAAEGRKETALGLLAAVDPTILDAHHRFHLAEAFAMAGDAPRALALFEQAVDTSFFPHQFFARYCPFLDPLRGMPEFERILARAAQRVKEFEV